MVGKSGDPHRCRPPARRYYLIISLHFPTKDLAGFLISLVALTLARRPASQLMSYGYHRAEILGALGSLALVWLMTVWLVVEALGRLSHPPPIDGRLMSGIAAMGVLVNGLY